LKDCSDQNYFKAFLRHIYYQTKKTTILNPTLLFPGLNLDVGNKTFFKMATSRAANIVEKAMRHPDEASVATDVSNYSKDKYGERAQKIKALTWQGKNSVKVGRRSLWICFQSPNPCDVILLIYVLSS
jgi:hypothetical protein